MLYEASVHVAGAGSTSPVPHPAAPATLFIPPSIHDLLTNARDAAARPLIYAGLEHSPPMEPLMSDAVCDLADKNCVPCQGGVPPLTAAEIAPLAKQLGDGWSVVDNHHLRRVFTFPDFAQALAFTNAVGAIAEAEWHHPDLELAWGRVGVTIFTHKIDGLAEADFILAAKIDRAAPTGSD